MKKIARPSPYDTATITTNDLDAPPTLTHTDDPYVLRQQLQDAIYKAM